MDTALPLRWEAHGYLQKQDIIVVHMTRDEFVSIIEDALLDDEYYTPIANDMLATARSMITFPFDSWIQSQRGCGCVVGEYLVAQEAIRTHNKETARSELAGTTARRVYEILMSMPNGTALYDFGHYIDDQMRQAIDGRVQDTEGLIAEYQDPAEAVDAIVIDDA